jgi:DNA-binding MarR family transcriptional regulator
VAKGNALLKERGRKSRAADETPQERESLNGVRGAKTTEERLPHLDRLIHERLRLGILSALAVNKSMTFNELKETMKTTDGNLSVHARKLEDAEYITCEKYFEGRTPKTAYKLTTQGRRALERYLDHMEALIKAMRVR